MKTKTCTKCGIEKSIKEFSNGERFKNNIRSWCKECDCFAASEYYKIYKKEKLKYAKEYRIIHKKEIQEYRDRHKQESKQYRQFHKKELAVGMKQYRQFHKKELNNQRRKRKEEDINFKIRCNVSNRILGALKNNSKSLQTMFLIGCSVKYLMYHIQCQFGKDMNWDNHGRGWHGKKEWQIDHIIPCASFDLSKPSEQRKCFNYTNLQPLWAQDNRKKGNKFVGSLKKRYKSCLKEKVFQ